VRVESAGGVAYVPAGGAAGVAARPVSDATAGDGFAGWPLEADPPPDPEEDGVGSSAGTIRPLRQAAVVKRTRRLSDRPSIGPS
jgi:hypothetical protein